MASGAQGPKQSRGYFVPLGSCVGKIHSYTPGSGAGGSYLPGNFSIATWSQPGGAAGPLLSSISSIGAGGLLRDMGKTVVSSNRTFRKVQLLGSSQADGVTNGSAAANDFTSQTTNPYLTGYVELATGRSGVPSSSIVPTPQVAPLAYLPGLMM
jgi:hypothetical protein